MSLKDKIDKNLDAKINIVVVDDDPKVLRTLQRVLKPLPYKISYFDSPYKVLENIEELDVSLIVSDNMMPGMSGLELLNELIQRFPDCQRYLLTGATESQQAIEAFNEGTINQFIQKPWDNKRLIDLINEGVKKYKEEKSKEITSKIKDHALLKQSEQFEKAKQALNQTQTELEIKRALDVIDEIKIPVNMKSLSILVVEQNKNISTALVEALKKIGFFHCEAVGSADRALEILIKSSWVKVILSDWDLKGMDGLQLFQAIQLQSGIDPKPYFVLVSSKTQKEQIEQAIQLKIDGYVIKPFRLETLIEQLHAIAKKSGILDVAPSNPKKSKSNFLIAGNDYDLCNTINNHLTLGGIEKISITHSGKAVVHILNDKKIDVLFYHDGLQDPCWFNLMKKLNVENINCSHLKMVIFSHVGIKPEQQAAHDFDFPVSFLNRRFDKDSIFIALNQMISGSKLSDFNYRL